MSAWRKFLEEESEYQFTLAVFTFAVIIVFALIDWSDNLSGFHEGAAIEQKGIIHDSAGDAIIFENDSESMFLFTTMSKKPLRYMSSSAFTHYLCLYGTRRNYLFL